MLISVFFQTMALLLYSGCMQTYDPVKKQCFVEKYSDYGAFSTYLFIS